MVRLRVPWLRLLVLLCLSVGTTVALLVLVPLIWAACAALWAWVGLRFVLALPGLLVMAWDDWRFHRRRSPGCPYTLWGAIRLQAMVWAKDYGIR